MKLSEAIRLGAMMGKQAFGRAYGANGSACANGAAMQAVGGYSIWVEWPWLRTDVTCPACKLSGTTGVAIAHLNDIHRWTREAIADWVATIEPEEVHASETIREVQSGLGPMRSPLEVETFETITK